MLIEPLAHFIKITIPSKLSLHKSPKERAQSTFLKTLTYNIMLGKKFSAILLCTVEPT